MQRVDCERGAVAALNVEFYSVVIPLSRGCLSFDREGCLHATGVHTSFTIDYL